MKTNTGGSLHQSADTGSASPVVLQGARATCIRGTLKDTLTHEATQQEPESSGVVTAAPAAASPTCVHWWVYQMPNGPTTTGTCRKCGESHVRFNAGVDSPYYEEAMAKRRSRAGAIAKQAAAANRGAKTGAQNATFYRDIKSTVRWSQ